MSGDLVTVPLFFLYTTLNAKGSPVLLAYNNVTSLHKYQLSRSYWLIFRDNGCRSMNTVLYETGARCAYKYRMTITNQSYACPMCFDHYSDLFRDD